MALSTVSGTRNGRGMGGVERENEVFFHLEDFEHWEMAENCKFLYSENEN